MSKKQQDENLSKLIEWLQHSKTVPKVSQRKRPPPSTLNVISRKIQGHIRSLEKGIKTAEEVDNIENSIPTAYKEVLQSQLHFLGSLRKKYGSSSGGESGHPGLRTSGAESFSDESDFIDRHNLGDEGPSSAVSFPSPHLSDYAFLVAHQSSPQVAPTGFKNQSEAVSTQHNVPNVVSPIAVAESPQPSFSSIQPSDFSDIVDFG